MKCVLNTRVVFLSLLQSFSQLDLENFPTPFTGKNAIGQNGRIPDLEIEVYLELRYFQVQPGLVFLYHGAPLRPVNQRQTNHIINECRV